MSTHHESIGVAPNHQILDQASSVSVLGVGITNPSREDAIAAIENWITARDAVSRSLYLVNAHTLNLAYEDTSYRRVLNAATAVFGDGTGVRWGARSRGVRMRANLVGTDLLPDLFAATAGRGYRYFLLGGSESAIERAARYAEARFPGWQLVGHHHGYVWGDSARVTARINDARPHLLLVGMGNPLQERWIHEHLPELRVPLSVGVGGLFDHWAGNLKRAPLWVRHLGIEWLQILLQQPHKWRRYLIGNWLFLARLWRTFEGPAAQPTSR
jgi:N-acetylglucosaminyldiphosphoundecaprenol N-acetyl-beta-D-mannosaminyltransferase